MGRVAFPLFAYLIALGYNRTSSYEKYLKKLVTFSVITIIPYYYFADGLNVLFTLAFGLIAIHYYKKRNYIIPLILIILAQILDMSYGWFGVTMILIFNIFLDKPNKFIFTFVALTVVRVVTTHNTIHLYSLMSLFILAIDFGKIEFRLPKYFFCWFYPVHMVLLIILRNII